MLVLLFDGLFATNSVSEVPESLGSSKILDLASHKALDTGEWYIPGHKLIGFLKEDPASIGCEFSPDTAFSGFGFSLEKALL